MKSVRTLFVAGIVLSVCGLAFCQDAGPASRPVRIISPMGTLVKVEGKDLLIDVGQKEAITVATDDNTEFRVDSDLGKLEDLKPQMSVIVTSLPALTGRSAMLMVTAASKALSGTVVRIEGQNLWVRVTSGAEPKEVAIATDDSTIVLFVIQRRGEQAKIGKLADLRADMRVKVIPETGTAKKILAAPALRPRIEAAPGR